MSTIPANELVVVNPSVIGAGGSALDLTGLVLTTNTRAPYGATVSFPSALAVSSYFGPTSLEARIAGGGAGFGSGYFAGFIGATKLPATLKFAQYPTSAIAAYLRGGNISALTLAQLQALSGTLTVSIDGYSRPGGAVNLSAATSFSSAAGIIQGALNAAAPTLASFTASIAGNSLIVAAVTSGTLAVGQTVQGTGVAAGSIITALGSGVGGTGTYVLAGGTQGVGSEGMTTVATALTVTYDSVSGAFVVTSGITGPASTAAFATGTLAPSVLLTQASGAVLSQGANAATPAAFMNSIIVADSNWVCFMTAFDPDGGVGNAQKQAFAAWKNAQNNRFAYVCWDTDITPTQGVPAAASLGQILPAANDSGTCLIYEATDLNLAAFVLGTAASINFSQRNGRITFAFKAQAGLVASVSDPTTAQNLAGNPQVPGSTGNNYNFYGAYGAANQNFTWFQRGFVTGPYLWLDSYLNQIWLNNGFQVALLNLLANALSIPYTAAGNSLIQAALMPQIQAGLNFGAFAPGSISASEAAAVNNQAGANISSTLQTQGWYLQILPATAAQRAARASPPMTFWYLDRGSVQAITLASIALQ
jgi:hypothetical protein